MRNQLILLAALSTGSCAITQETKYVVPQGQPSASLIFDVESDSTNGNTMQFDSRIFTESTCHIAQSPTLGRKIAANSHEEFAAATIPAQRAVRIGLFYSEFRHDERRACSYVSEFSPIAGKRYTAIFNATNESMNCTLEIVDETGGKIESTTVNECEVAPGMKMTSGIGGATKIKTKVIINRY